MIPFLNEANLFELRASVKNKRSKADWYLSGLINTGPKRWSLKFVEHISDTALNSIKKHPYFKLGAAWNSIRKVSRTMKYSFSSSRRIHVYINSVDQVLYYAHTWAWGTGMCLGHMHLWTIPAEEVRVCNFTQGFSDMYAKYTYKNRLNIKRNLMCWNFVDSMLKRIVVCAAL